MATTDSAELQALRRGARAGAREIRLTGLHEFPREVFGLADTLELLDLSDGTIEALPDDLGRLKHLKVLFCSGNRFDRLPPVLGDCAALSQIGFRATGLREVPAEALPPRLRWLTLTDNAIPALPDALGHRPLLQKLMLAGNRLTALPDSLAGAGNLELLRLSANRFETLPPWLGALPRLAWLAYAGNPAEPAAVRSSGSTVPWADLEPGPLLGEGASGRIYAARWRGAPGDGAVAVKLFKGRMTSDGLPDHEMEACLAAGDHPALVGALGRVTDHPDGVPGLVMPLLPRFWRGLAGPPSLASCSRDVFAPETVLTPDQVLRIAGDIAHAAVWLHGRGLLHGDLYAHNTHWDPATGSAVLGDFGAASRLPVGREGESLQRIEVRAWGILAAELLACCPEAEQVSGEFGTLVDACLQENVTARPAMSEVVLEIESLVAQPHDVPPVTSRQS